MDVIFGALCPSKSGLMNKHIVKHIVDVELTEGKGLTLSRCCSGLMNKLKTYRETYRETSAKNMSL